MSTYQVELTAAAIKSLAKVHPKERGRIEGAITLLAIDPRPPAARPLKGRNGWRLRVGDHRILYVIDDGILVTVVVAVGHRREVYR